MPLTKLQFRPGLVQDLTSYSNEGGWRDGDKVRFRLGYPEKIGGWAKYTSSTFLGSCRALHNWIALDGSDFLGLGTHLKYYVEEGGTYNDITPIRETTAAGDVTFAAANGSTTLVVTDSNHGAVLGDFVTFSGAVSLGGNVTAAILNAEHEVTAVTNNNVYEVTLTVTANASDTGNGGASVVGAYQINIGLNSQVGGTGWGAGSWSRANHPVEDLANNVVMITSQNHGFAVDEENLPDNLVATHRSLFDGSLQGIRRTDKPAFSFQGHPEASPGPHDAASLFDHFIALMEARRS